MSQIRADIFTQLLVYNNTREKYIEKRVHKAYQSLRKNFTSKKEFIEYINQISDPQMAELFIKSANYYYEIKKIKNRPIFKLIMLFSLTEKLGTGLYKHESFTDWVRKQDELVSNSLNNKVIDTQAFKQILCELEAKYNESLGSRHATYVFFKEYLSDKDKFTLIHSTEVVIDSVNRYSERLVTHIRVHDIHELTKQGYNVGSFIMPCCYDWRSCYYDGGDCKIEKGCLLIEDQKYKEKKFRNAIDLICQIRHDFVHDAKIGMTEECGFISAVTSKGQLFVDLQIKDIEPIIERAVINYFSTQISSKGSLKNG